MPAASGRKLADSLYTGRRALCSGLHKTQRNEDNSGRGRCPNAAGPRRGQSAAALRRDAIRRPEAAIELPDEALELRHPLAQGGLGAEPGDLGGRLAGAHLPPADNVTGGADSLRPTAREGDVRRTRRDGPLAAYVRQAAHCQAWSAAQTLTGPRGPLRAGAGSPTGAPAGAYFAHRPRGARVRGGCGTAHLPHVVQKRPRRRDVSVVRWLANPRGRRFWTLTGRPRGARRVRSLCGGPSRHRPNSAESGETHRPVRLGGSSSGVGRRCAPSWF
jgi:hypothetical protein